MDNLGSLRQNRKIIRAILKSKKKKGVSDPPRFPKVSDKFEGRFKKNFAKTLQNILDSIAKDMVSIKSKNNGKGKN